MGSSARVRIIRFPGDRANPDSFAKCVIETTNSVALAVTSGSTEHAESDRHLLVGGLLSLDHFNSRNMRRRTANELWLCSERPPERMMRSRIDWIDPHRLAARIRLIDFRGNCASGPIKRRTHRVQLRWPSVRPEFMYDSDKELSRTVTEWTNLILSIARDHIEVRPLSRSQGVRLMINGLEFVRITVGNMPRLEYGVFERRAICGSLDNTSMSEITALVRSILRFRLPMTSETMHPLYRLRTEAWLESRLRADIRALDPSLNPDAVYAQVPAWRGRNRSVMDLLAINNRGRLVVIEVKANEDITLPFQGLDYWICVEEARRRGEFQKRGFFSGVQIANTPAELWLVTPELRFHRRFEMIAQSISRNVPIMKIALGGDWRNRVIVRERKRMNQGG